MSREMRRGRQALPEEMCEAVLSRGSHGVLALAGDEGYPYAVPISYVYEGGKLYFHCARSGHKLDAIARLAERIRPDKMQINSVCRPPAETYALPVPAARLLEIQKHFAGVPGTVEIIAEHLDDMAHTAFRTQIKEEDILALIERRPCTAAGTAAGLNIHITEAIKHLEMLVADGKAVTQPKDGQVFYSACELRTE